MKKKLLLTDRVFLRDPIPIVRGFAGIVIAILFGGSAILIMLLLDVSVLITLITSLSFILSASTTFFFTFLFPFKKKWEKIKVSENGVELLYRGRIVNNISWKDIIDIKQNVVGAKHYQEFYVILESIFNLPISFVVDENRKALLQIYNTNLDIQEKIESLFFHRIGLFSWTHKIHNSKIEIPQETIDKYLKMQKFYSNLESKSKKRDEKKND